MGAPHTFDDVLRIHDLAVEKWLSGCVVKYGSYEFGTPAQTVDLGARPILVVMSSPSRLAADVPTTLVSRNWIPGLNADEMRQRAEQSWSTLPLPIATLERDDPLFDPELANVLGVNRAAVRRADGSIIPQRAPRHFRTQYRVTFWCNMHSTKAFILEWLNSQFGMPGCGPRERLIAVTHPDPLGVQQQSFIHDNTVDLSELEGEGQRQFRFMASFRLRTWFTFPLNEADATYPVMNIEAAFDDASSQVSLDAGHVMRVSGNLFRVPWGAADVPERWPTSGNGLVTELPISSLPSERFTRGFRGRITTSEDAVILANDVSPLDGDTALYVVSFRYRASSSVDFEVSQAVSTASTYSRVLRLPAANSWRQVTLVTPVTRADVMWSFVGAGSASIVDFVDVDIRQIDNVPDARVPAVVNDAGLVEWAGLTPGASYVVVGVLDAAPAGPYSVAIYDDPRSSLPVSSQLINPAVDVGFGQIIQPQDTSIVLRVDPIVPLATAYALRYSGPYHGHDI